MVTHSRGHMRSQLERGPRGAEGFPNHSRATRSYWPVSRCVIRRPPGKPGLEHLNVHSEWERSDLGIPECLTFISVHMGNNCEWSIHSYFL